MRPRPTHPLSVVLLLAVATFIVDGEVDPPRGLAFAWSMRWWILGAAAVVAIVAHVTVERRRTYPACGVRGFTRVMRHAGDTDDQGDLWYDVRHCRACGIRQVECGRGVERFTAADWEYAAGRYARREDGPPPPPTCDACGYDLRATPDRCPECGTVARFGDQGNPLFRRAPSLP